MLWVDLLQYSFVSGRPWTGTHVYFIGGVDE